MSVSNLLSYFIIWGFLGVVLYSFFVIMLFRRGLVYESRRSDGLMKKVVSLKGMGLSLILFIGILLMQLLAAFSASNPIIKRFPLVICIFSVFLYIWFICFMTLW